MTVSEDLAAHAMLAGSASEEHLAALAARAARMKVPWNLTGEHGGIAPKADSEEALYAALGLPYIEPEIREDHGEFDAAEKGKLPKLLEWTDLKGSLHNHSTWSDGHQRPEEIAKAMRELGLDISGNRPQRLTDDLAQWADLVVTMGCGDECPYLPGKRYIDWDLLDPADLPIEQVRLVRDDIEARVHDLVGELDARAAPKAASSAN